MRSPPFPEKKSLVNIGGGKSRKKKGKALHAEQEHLGSDLVISSGERKKETSLSLGTEEGGTFGKNGLLASEDHLGRTRKGGKKHHHEVVR